MHTDSQACYRALKSHDRRFDGVFFVGVSSTGIYCRPVCRVRLPKAENCTFYACAAAAEMAGFRPCLRCRPELAPGRAAIDLDSRLARSAARLIESSLHEPVSISALAARVGVSDRHLRRLFDQAFGVPPSEYRQTQRLLLAKRLLTDTAMSVTEVAGAAGFGSLRRFNATLRERYRMSPTELRAARRSAPSTVTGAASQVLSFELPVRTPYDWPAMAAFLASRAIEGVEWHSGQRYSRVVTAPGRDGLIQGWITAGPGDRDDALRIELSSSLAPVVAWTLSWARALFDLDADPAQVNEALGELAANRPGLRVPGAASGFEIAVRAILGQQVTVKAARTLAVRFAACFGTPVVFEDATLARYAFPEPAALAGMDYSQVAELGIIARRAQCIVTLAQVLSSGAIELTPEAPVEPTLKALQALPGIGDWTAQYIALRALRWPDAFPAADHGVMKALGVKTPARARQQARPWQPWRAYAVMHLWASLAEGTDPSRVDTRQPAA